MWRKAVIAKPIIKTNEAVCPKCAKAYLVYGRNGKRYTCHVIRKKRKNRLPDEYLVRSVRCECGWGGKEWYKSSYSHHTNF